jgi:hypothetical protein
VKQKIIVAIVLLAVVGVFALGILDFDKTVMWARHYFFRARGEVASLSAGRPTGNPNHARICRENLQRIQSAKRKAAQDRGVTVGEVTWDEVLHVLHPNYIPGRSPRQRFNELMPKCPGGGTYSLGTLQEVASCSIGGNDNMDPADDHLILD